MVPNVRSGYQTHNNPPVGSPEDWDLPDMTVVTDENGEVFRFFNVVISGDYYFVAIPSNQSEQDNYLATLELTDPSASREDWNSR